MVSIYSPRIENVVSFQVYKQTTHGRFDRASFVYVLISSIHLGSVSEGKLVLRRAHRNEAAHDYIGVRPSAEIGIL